MNLLKVSRCCVEDWGQRRYIAGIMAVRDASVRVTKRISGEVKARFDILNIRLKEVCGYFGIFALLGFLVRISGSWCASYTITPCHVVVATLFNNVENIIRFDDNATLVEQPHIKIKHIITFEFSFGS
jgi:hypothetical protein